MNSKPDGYYWNQLQPHAQELLKQGRVEMNRRSMLKLTGAAVVGAAVIPMAGCGDKEDVEFYVGTVVDTLDQLKSLLPAQSDMLSKGISIAKSFNSAYQAGKFDSAMTLFENLVNLVNDVIAAAGIGVSDGVKVALAVAGIAVRGIAVLLKKQVADPLVAAGVKERAQASDAGAKRVSLIESLANPKAVDAVFAASKP